MVKDIKFALCAAAVSCAASVAFAEWTPVTNSFESADSSFDGGSIANLTYEYTKDIGLPLAGDHAKVLYLEGDDASVVNSDDSANSKRTLDFMMMAEELDEEGLPEDEETTPQFRLAFSNRADCVRGDLYLYHTKVSGAVGWTKVKSNVPTQTWVRVTMNIVYPAETFDYAYAQLVIDGSSCVTSDGYGSSDGSVTEGSWYKAATSANMLTSVKFSGLGGVDDFILSPMPESGSGINGGTNETDGVQNGWLIDNQIALEDADGTPVSVDEKLSDSSAYTIKESFEAGVDPRSSTPLYVTNATFDVAGKLALTINGKKKSGEVTAYRVRRSTTSNMSSPNSAAESGVSDGITTKFEIDLPTGLTETTPYFYQVETVSGSVTNANKFGLLTVVNSNADVIIPAPWVALGYGIVDGLGSDVSIAKLISTNNLTKGDIIYYYDAGVYKTWTLEDNGWTANHVVQTDKLQGDEASATDVMLSRGDGVWLHRNNPTNSAGNPIPFYIYGQNTDAAISTTIANGTQRLLANPKPDASVDLTAVVSEPDAGDEIYVVQEKGFKKYTHDSSGWGYQETKTKLVGPEGNQITIATGEVREDAGSINIAPGQGFWYSNTNNTKNVTINWDN